MHFEAYFVPRLKHDLIGGRAIPNELGFQILLDADDDVSGIFIKHKGKLCGIEYSIPFISEDSSLFRIATLDIVEKSYKKLNSFDLWHSRLGHVSNKVIHNTVHHVLGLEFRLERLPKNIPHGHNCPDCRIGKCERRDAPGMKIQVRNPLEQVH